MNSWERQQEDNDREMSFMFENICESDSNDDQNDLDLSEHQTDYDSDEDQTNDNFKSLSLVAIALSALKDLRNQKQAKKIHLKRRVINRNRIRAEQTLHYHYFSEKPIYPEQIFRGIFRMKRDLFLRIVEEVERSHWFFKQREDAVGNIGFSARHKVTVALRQLGYGCSADSLDEYLKIGETTALESLKYFCCCNRLKIKQ